MRRTARDNPEGIRCNNRLQDGICNSPMTCTKVGRCPYSAPDRYLSTNTYDGTRYWRVIGSDGCPECRDGELDAALFTWARFDRTTPRADIPVWDGDAGIFTTYSAVGGDNA